MAIDQDELIGAVREMLRDDPQLNVLLGRREFSAGVMKVAVRMMVSEFNRINWVSTFAVETFPDNTYDVQIYGTIYHLLNSAACLNVRNHLPYKDSGLSVAQWSKSGEYAGLAERFRAIFTEGATQIKWAMNIEQGFGGVMSEYAFTAGWSTVYGHSF